MSNRQIRLPLHDSNVGDMLTEVVRAYLYTGTPSALLSRITQGVRNHTEENQEKTADDAHVLVLLQARLQDAQDEIHMEEDYRYGPVTASIKREQEGK